MGVQTGQAMSSALNVVQTSHSYGDLMLLMKATQLQQVCVLLSMMVYQLLKGMKNFAANYYAFISRNNPDEIDEGE